MAARSRDRRTLCFASVYLVFLGSEISETLRCIIVKPLHGGYVMVSAWFNNAVLRWSNFRRAFYTKITNFRFSMVCLLAAPWVQLSVSAGNGWPHNALRHHWLMPVSCHFRDCKALQLVTSLTHASGAISSVETFIFLPLIHRFIIEARDLGHAHPLLCFRQIFTVRGY